MGHFNATTLSADDLKPDKLAFNPWVTRFAQFHSDDYGFDQLRVILEMAKQRHMLVIGYMPPYHPAMYDILLKRTQFTPLLNYVTHQLDIFEKEYPFHYLNFIGSEAFSKGDAMFNDIIHPSIHGSALMMEQLYEQFHSLAEG